VFDQLGGAAADIGRMPSLLHRSRRFVACLAVLTPLAAMSGAQAATASTPRDACGQRVIEHPFAQWGDVADYFMVEQGDLSGDAVEWDLGGGALVADNNPFTLHGAEQAALSLSEGDSATGAMVCVGVNDPTMRFFVRNSGSATGTLKVEVLYEDDAYITHSLPLGVLTSLHAGDRWTPSPALALAAPLVSLLDGGLTPVWFRFTAEGAGSAWLVDDVYVDPYGKG
jgi:hypothetical protein